MYPERQGGLKDSTKTIISYDIVDGKDISKRKVRSQPPIA